ncbi:Gypsy retrotransposon integrase 1 [Elysia marginata]|uniref:Gypsy retrotransposon integrase 1 n=1 Tax=Elysia marginata TaxID=1093978 RepID=A0AAV4F9V7_9GAST|nr:Gypsy retrotransposon integrase 1 [Elysia marginata]
MGELLHPHSCECSFSGLDIFTVPPTQSSVESGFWVEHHPISTLTDTGPVEFVVNGSGEEYIDLPETYLHVRVKVTKSDGGALTDGDKVAPSNLFAQALFSQVDVSLNGHLTTPSQNTYPWRCYLESLLSYGPDALQSQLALSGFCRDTAGDLDVMDGDRNKGFLTRAKWVEESKECDMVCRVHADIFHQEKLLINGVSLKLRFVRSKDAFVLLAPDNQSGYRVKLTQASLYVRRCKVNPAIVLAHEKALQSGTAKYPIKRVEVKAFSVGQGQLSFVEDNLFTGQVPKRLIFGMVDSASFNGTYEKNPFHFKHNSINYLSLCVDGRQVPSKPLTPAFDKGLWARSYMSVFQGTGTAWKDKGFDISYDEYGKGYTLFCFDLTPTLTNGCSGEVELVKSGVVRLEARFSQPLQQPIHVVVYAERDGLIEIHRSREVFADFTA